MLQNICRLNDRKMLLTISVVVILTILTLVLLFQSKEGFVGQSSIQVTRGATDKIVASMDRNLSSFVLNLFRSSFIAKALGELTSDDSQQCTSAFQAYNSGSEDVIVRIFNAKYRLCATCVRVESQESKDVVDLKWSTGSSLVLSLLPLGIFVNGAMRTVTQLNSSPNGVQVETDAGPLTDLLPKRTISTVTLIYLDFMEPILDFKILQATSNSSGTSTTSPVSSVITSILDPVTSSVTITSTSSSLKVSFSRILGQIPSLVMMGGPSPTAQTAGQVIVPGIANLAKFTLETSSAYTSFQNSKNRSFL
ncbi:hypothetical protein CEUSTIGMA_g12688.t1 [Chlamydomonas eustigma]|uniref:Transmembrane protein n=1 Tax=Chlamydomonas eustigma TaxID=1157962 RepID=A0A250XQN7_9CHLO|nr:hypothetical protein CEUSTIGMA_g12688.t1 [Chlamydomonas eustigma]|eukprot:GAX85269.1 hypothetical protein CEUSTIGMA_g12688.t1 [Chlamydomonas eustigma]